MSAAPDKKKDRTAAERKRRQRAREASGRWVIRVEVSQATIASLIEHGYLSPEDVPAEIGIALGEFLDLVGEHLSGSHTVTAIEKCI